MSAVSSKVLDAAIEWQLCLDSGTASDEQKQQFALWLAIHPDHAKVWQQLNGLDVRLASAADAPARHALLHSAPKQRRRVPRAVLSLVLSAGLALAALHQHRPLSDYLADEHTGFGEQRELQLSDRSRVRLNSGSALDIRFDEKQRLLYLRSGEILIETAAGDTRPFIVETGQGRLRALGTRFLVRREGDATRLTVLQSAVAATPANRSEKRVINAGQEVLMQRDQLGPNQPAALGAEAWSHGMLVADNMPLADLLAALSDYRNGYLSVHPSLAGLRISGSFPLHDTDKALAALPPSLPVQIEQIGDWWTRVIPAERAK
ncbi:FecR domain-containing protein [Pseudomonas sp. TTU2014-080ASC]|uniref:FecR domain-containing protein n=1 Tax=Pseudomonas sp. TTU2014-080ASC TaxID=1729724 RepID=UPI0007188E3E|nr:FecR family protein [Pseudomonas sp. TTU2014-080ASC]KRW58890.1 amino acid ABC transporter substrate-binding protein [Pseudomonas sp. TTU2014-080ASC]